LSRELLWGPSEGFAGSLPSQLGKVLASNLAERLKSVRQLGLLPFLVGGADHSRFEHSCGATLVCSQVMERLKTHGPVTNFDIEALMGAALLHDIGHYPLSHATERAFLGSPLKAPTHKEISLRLVRQACDSAGFPDQLTCAIEWLLRPEAAETLPKELGANGFKPHTFKRQLLSGALDIDRLDFVLRDAIRIGLLPWTEADYGQFLTTLIESLTLRGLTGVDGAEDFVLCVEEKYLGEVLRFLWLRLLLYSYVYFHEEVRALEGTYVVVFWLLGEAIGEEGLRNEVAQAAHASCGSDEEILGQFVAQMNDQTYTKWFLELLDSRADEMDSVVTGAKKMAQQLRETLDDPSKWGSGFVQLPTTFRLEDVSPLYKPHLSDWHAWEPLLRAIVRSGRSLPEVPVPSIVTPLRDEDRGLLILRDDKTVYSLGSLGSTSHQFQRHFARRLNRVDFYCSKPSSSDSKAFAQLIDEVLHQYAAP